ncbi:DUF692 domain-containing protein [Corallincola platygyrae]
MAELLSADHPLPFVEILADNFLAMRGVHYQMLQAVAERYPVALHCVGMSVGSEVNSAYLMRVALMAKELNAISVSDHLSLSQLPGAVVHDLLPICYQEPVISGICANIKRIQSQLEVPFLLENVSRYTTYRDDNIQEGELFHRLHDATGVGMLLDVNNVYVTAHNLNLDAELLLLSYPRQAVCQYHLAGHQSRPPLLVDTHGSHVCAEVWELYLKAIAHFGGHPTIIEWDNDIPPLVELLTSADRAQHLMTPVAGVA